MQAGTVSLNVGPLRALTADLKKHGKYRIHVGIFAGKDARTPGAGTGPSDPTLGNAEIGTIQEFGSITKHIPERSFLRVPLIQYLPAAIASLGAAGWKASLLKDGMVKTLNRLGWTARNVVQDAFDSHGFGMWPPNAKRTIQNKKSSSPLIDSAEMRQAITHRVVTR